MKKVIRCQVPPEVSLGAAKKAKANQTVRTRIEK